jgi:hypothetical protein
VKKWLRKINLQWGSEYWTSPIFKWSILPDCQRNGNLSKTGENCLVFEWLKPDGDRKLSYHLITGPKWD